MSNDPTPDHPADAAGPPATLPHESTSPDRPSRRFAALAQSDPSEVAIAAPGPLALIGAAITVGVVAGFLELAVFKLQIDVLHRVGLGTLKISRHASWMIPAAGAAVAIPALLALTLPASVIARRPRLARWSWDWCGTTLGTFLVLGPVLAVRGLHGGAALFVSIAIGYRLRRLVARPSSAWRTAAIALGAIGLFVLPAYALSRWSAIAGAEARAWAAPPVAKNTPNLIWIVLDTVRADHLSLYGYPRPTSPSLEAWAKQGLTFDQARSAAPWTLPSHVTMFTGLWPSQHGARVDRPYFGSSPTLAEHLASNGYATAGFAANTGMCNACYGVGRGFDYYLDHPCNHEVGPAAALRNSVIGTHAMRLARKVKIKLAPIDFPFRKVLTAPEIAALGREWLDRAERRNTAGADTRRPTFLFLNFMDAHGPYLPPAARPQRFSTGPELTPKQATPEAAWSLLKARDDAAPADKPGLQRQLDGLTIHLVEAYDECLAGLDAEVGRLLDGLHKAGRLDNTWVVITADHGEHFGEHGQYGHGTSLYNALTHVPLLMIPPGRDAAHPKGRRIAAPVSLRDLPNTMTGLLLGSDAKNPFPGRSLVRHFAADAEPDPTLAQQEEQHLEGQDVRTDQVKTINAVTAEGHTLIASDGKPDELYRLDDAKQERDLAARPEAREIQRRLRHLLEQTLGGRSD